MKELSLKEWLARVGLEGGNCTQSEIWNLTHKKSFKVQKIKCGKFYKSINLIERKLMYLFCWKYIYFIIPSLELLIHTLYLAMNRFKWIIFPRKTEKVLSLLTKITFLFVQITNSFLLFCFLPKCVCQNVSFA